MAQIIAIEGLSGVGKSTLAPLVARRLGVKQAPAIPLGLLNERQAADAMRDPSTRHLFYLWALARCSQAVSTIDGQVVIDSFVGRTMAYHLGMGSCLDINPWSVVSRPSLSVLITCDEAERCRRLAARGRPLGYWQQRGEDAVPVIQKIYDSYCNVAVANDRSQPHEVAEIEKTERIRSVAVMGAADGKFVLPLVEAGYRVTAIDVNESALLGWCTRRGKSTERYTVSLKDRLELLDVDEQVEIVNGDVRDCHLTPHDALWTSCSWHYSLNFDRPLGVLTEALKRAVQANGIIGAEYFMPVTTEHEQCPFYLTHGEVWHYFAGWQRMWDAYTPPFLEQPHLGQPTPHVHQMGFMLARAPDRA